jgi:hypothetical protein
MSDPRTIREVNLAQAGIEGRLGLLVKMGGAIVGLLVAVVGGIATLYVQIGNVKDVVADVKVEVAALKSTVEGLGGRIVRIETAVDSARKDILGRIQPPPSPPPQSQDTIAGGFYVTEAEAGFIRDFLKAPQREASKVGKFSLWDHVPQDLAQPLPDDLTAKIPKLKGLRFAIDPSNSAIALIEPSQNLIVAIV